jgi:hypothetical protein
VLFPALLLLLPSLVLLENAAVPLTQPLLLEVLVEFEAGLVFPQVEPEGSLSLLIPHELPSDEVEPIINQ